jgi:hypothetical protein
LLGEYLVKEEEPNKSAGQWRNKKPKECTIQKQWESASCSWIVGSFENTKINFIWQHGGI